jgi:hypothetical protein
MGDSEMLQDLTNAIGRDQVFVLILLGLSALVGLAFFIPIQWRKVRQAEIEAALKHAMLERGMSAADIKQVLDATTGQSLGLAALGQNLAKINSGS